MARPGPIMVTVLTIGVLTAWVVLAPPAIAQARLYHDGDQVYPAAWSRDGTILVTVVTRTVPEIRLVTSA